MMTMKRTFYFASMFMAIIALQSCETPKEAIQEKPNEPVEGIAESLDIPFRVIADGYLTGNGEEGIGEGGMVINSKEQWEALVTKMNSVNETMKEEPIDFDKMTVLAYFDQIRGSGGYSVAISSVARNVDRLSAVVKKTPSKGMDIEIMTQPFIIGFIDKTSKSIVFVD